MTKRKTTEEFISQAKAMHGDLDCFDKVEYKGSKVKVCITCKEHGDYWMTPNCYLNGQRCPICGRRKVNQNKVISFDEFKRRAVAVHGDKYDYSKVNYVSALTKVEVVCPEHGSFFITPAHLWEGHGCKECAKKVRNNKEANTYEEFVEKANKVHGNNKTSVKITCPVHGDFYQRPDGHLSGRGCPHCGHSMSKAEDEIYNYLLQYVSEGDVIRHDKGILDGLEIDIYLPKCSLGIEYNGLRWHSEEFGKDRYYHLNKTEVAESKGVHLIQIFEDEWVEHKELILEKLRHFIGCSNSKVIGARKCRMCEIDKKIAKSFLDNYHIQGFAASTVYLGAYYNNELVGVMAFLKEKDGYWNLTRFSTDYVYSLPGLANKMFKWFVNEYKPLEVKTFLDRRWSHSNCNIYDRMSFELVEIERPDYRYVVGYERRHKFGFRKNILHKKYGLPLEMTESEMVKELGIYRIWDCGLYKYLWKNSG